jgi:hypothetical protein
MRRHRAFSEIIIHKLPEGDDGIPILPEIVQLGLEDRRSDSHAVGDRGSKTVIEEYRDMYRRGDVLPVVCLSMSLREQKKEYNERYLYNLL